MRELSPQLALMSIPTTALQKLFSQKPNDNTNTILQTFALFPRLPPELRTTDQKPRNSPYLPPRVIKLSPKQRCNRLQIPIIPHICTEARNICKKRYQNHTHLLSAPDVPPFTLLFDYKNDILLFNDALPFSLELESRDIAAQALRSSGLSNVAFLDFLQVHRLALKVNLAVPGIGAAADVGGILLELQKSFTGLKELILIDGIGGWGCE